MNMEMCLFSKFSFFLRVFVSNRLGNTNAEKMCSQTMGISAMVFLNLLVVLSFSDHGAKCGQFSQNCATSFHSVSRCRERGEKKPTVNDEGCETQCETCCCCCLVVNRNIECKGPPYYKRLRTIRICFERQKQKRNLK